jgi:hypothetical protein
MTPSPHKTDYIIITIPLQWKRADIGYKVDHDRRGQQRLVQAANLTWPYPCEIVFGGMSHFGITFLRLIYTDVTKHTHT